MAIISSPFAVLSSSLLARSGLHAWTIGERRLLSQWTDRPSLLYKTRMGLETVFAENLHYVPDAVWPQTAFTVLRAGKVAAGATYGVRRESQVGQDVLFCLSGSGAVELGRRRVEGAAGEPGRAGRPLLPFGVGRGRTRKPADRGAGGRGGVDRQRSAARAYRGRARSLDAPLVPLRRSEPRRRAHAPVRRRGPASGGERQGRTRCVVRAAVPGVEAAGPQPRFSSQPARQRVLPVDGSLARHPCLARCVRPAQRRRRRGARRYRPFVERRGDRRSRRTKSFANPAAVSEELARKSAALAHPRAADRSAIPHDPRECAHRQHRRGLRVLRRVSLRPRVQTRGGRLARRLAADGTRRARHIANAYPPHSRPAQPADVVAGPCFGGEGRLRLASK